MSKKQAQNNAPAIEQGEIVDVNTIPQPLDSDVVDTSFAIDGSSMAENGITASTHEPEHPSREPISGEYVNVFYHPASRKYVQYNRSLEGRSDFQIKRVLRSDFEKLGVRA